MLYKEENLCILYLTKDESVVMNWTTEHLARKVRIGEKKKHKGRRAVEIMLQQSLSELRKSEDSIK